MTPAARIAAAGDLLDRIREGEPAERVLTGWARASRFAGSGDRAAVRDLVYSALRRRRSLGARSGGGDTATGRQLMIGYLLEDGADLSMIFNGNGHGPAALSEYEVGALHSALPPGEWPEAVIADCPEWLWPRFRGSLGDAAAEALRIMRDRAAPHIRVNLARLSRDDCAARLAAEGIATAPHTLASSALIVVQGGEKISRSKCYEAGLIEIQDIASQAACADVPLRSGMTVLDYCAGGGGKTLALAAGQPGAHFTAHDAIAHRLADLSPRAARAGVRVSIATTAALRGRKFDCVVADVPCSGSGTWARDPDTKWRLTPDRLGELAALQAQILNAAAWHVAANGRLVYMTCSLLADENEKQVEAFVAQNPGWHVAHERRMLPQDGGTGFYTVHLTRDQGGRTTSLS